MFCMSLIDIRSEDESLNGKYNRLDTLNALRIAGNGHFPGWTAPSLGPDCFYIIETVFVVL